MRCETFAEICTAKLEEKIRNSIKEMDSSKSVKKNNKQVEKQRKLAKRERDKAKEKEPSEQPLPERPTEDPREQVGLTNP